MSDRPIDPLVEAVINEGVVPLLEKVKKDLHQSLITDVIVFMEGVRGPRVRIGNEDTFGEADGELRVKIRRAHGHNRFLYSIESVYKREVSDVGFSGFVAKGEIHAPEEATPEVKPKSWTVRYHVWDFSAD